MTARTLREEFLAFDAALAAKGVPPLTEWWREGIGRWLDAYERGHVLELWACVGRGAAKSTALYKLAAFFALFGAFVVPPGERHYAIVLSRLKEEAAKGVAIISRWLTLLGVAHRPAGDVIDLVDLPRGIRVVAASVAATSGWRAFFVGKDERSKWPELGSDDLDASEIDTSAAAMTATHPDAPIITTGSAWGLESTFARAVLTGTTTQRVVLGPTPTWIAAPHVTEADCRRKEPDPRRFAREYACEFQAGALAAFDVDAVAAAFRAAPEGMVPGAPVMVCDPSTGRDEWAWGVVRFLKPKVTNGYKVRREWVPSAQRWVETIARDVNTGEPIVDPDAPPADTRAAVVQLVACGGWSKAAGMVGAEQIVGALASVAREHGCIGVVGDQFEQLALTSLWAARGYKYMPLAWTSPAKGQAVEQLRAWFRDRAIVLPDDDRLRQQLARFEERILPSGVVTFQGRADDRVSLLLMAARLHAEGIVPGPYTPTRKPLPSWVRP